MSTTKQPSAAAMRAAELKREVVRTRKIVDGLLVKVSGKHPSQWSAEDHKAYEDFDKARNDHRKAVALARAEGGAR